MINLANIAKKGHHVAKDQPYASRIARGRLVPRLDDLKQMYPKAKMSAPAGITVNEDKEQVFDFFIGVGSHTYGSFVDEALNKDLKRFDEWIDEELTRGKKTSKWTDREKRIKVTPAVAMRTNQDNEGESALAQPYVVTPSSNLIGPSNTNHFSDTDEEPANDEKTTFGLENPWKMLVQNQEHDTQPKKGKSSEKDLRK